MNRLCKVSPSIPRRSFSLGIGQAASVQYRTAVLEPDGTLRPLRNWKKNLILDVGLDSVGVRTWGKCLEYSAIGTGTTATSKDSGATTFTSAGTTLTASAGYFAAGDVGALFKPDTGTEVYITGFTSTTVVTTSADPGAAATQGTVWYVNQTGLTTELKRSNTTSGLGPNSFAWNAGTSSGVWSRTYIFTAEVGTVTYREVGWSWQAAGNLFGRDVLAGAGDTLVAGQQYVITVVLNVVVSPVTPAAVGNVGTGGIDTSGNAVVENVSQNASGSGDYAWSDPGVDGQGRLEPSLVMPGGCVATATWTQASATTGIQTPPATSPAGSGSLAAYTTGSFTRTQTNVFSVSQGNSATIKGFMWKEDPGNPSFSSIYFSVQFTADQAKTGSQTLTVVTRKSWQRALVN